MTIQINNLNGNFNLYTNEGLTNEGLANEDLTSEGGSFPLLTAQCHKEGKAQVVEEELRSATNGSAQKLMQCIRTNEALGYLDTKNMSTKALYDALKDYFGLKYGYPNFAKYR